jgi:serine/threonine protein phosphatase PrpC
MDVSALGTESTSQSVDGSLYLPCDVAFDPECRTALEQLRPKGDVPMLTEDRTPLYVASSGSLEYATLTLAGYKGGELSEQINQDRAFIVQPFFNVGDSFFSGVLDGHGDTGHFVSEFCRKELPIQLEAALNRIDTNNTKAVSEALIQVVEKVDELIPTDDGLNGGATSTLVLRLGTTLYFSNTGDSQSVVAGYHRNRGARIIFATRLDKPDHPEEKARVLAAGGTVTEASEDDEARVWHNIDGRSWGLAMSRSLGDHTATGVIATPVVTALDTVQLVEEFIQGAPDQMCAFEVYADGTTHPGTCNDSTDDDERIEAKDVGLFVVSASDGILDYVELQAIVDKLGYAFFNATSTEPYHPLTAAEELIHTAAKQWHDHHDGQYRDDIALAAVKLSR